MTNLIGISLGRYHILEQLGEGGMATVYKAFDTRLERDVAVKVIRIEKLTLDTIAKSLKRFEREARALAKLDHPNIVRINDYGEYEHRPFLVMDYIPGGTLKQRLGKPIPWQEAFHFIIPITHALEYAHQQGIIHRDVKPSNILIGKSGVPILTDFGIAKFFESQETIDLTGTMGVGTPEYMAPEQFQGQVDQRADIYSLGVVLYEMITGRKPYIADTPAAVIIKQATEPLPRPGLFVAGLPETVEKVLFKALAPKPEDRFQSMDAFGQALDTLASWQAVTAMPVKPISSSFLKPGTRATTLTDVTSDQLTMPSRKTAFGVFNPVIWVGIIVVGLIAILAVIFGLGMRGGFPIAKSPTGTVPPMHPLTSSISQTSTFTVPSIMTFTPISTATDILTSTSIIVSTPTPILGISSTRVRLADGMTMDYVPEGDFSMGSNNGDYGELPVHTVYLDAYWIDQTEVTNAMYALCVNAGDCQQPSSVSSNTHGSYFGNSQYNNYPVIYVRWADAFAYCNWSGARLPTEAEWEKAARWTDARTYPWGNSSPACSLVNYGSCIGDTVPVGGYPSGASPYGALDMAGNVWEWVNDYLYFSNDLSNLPASNPTGPLIGTDHLVRGGSWDSIETRIRSAVRDWRYPGYSYNYIGFRCAFSAAP